MPVPRSVALVALACLAIPFAPAHASPCDVSNVAGRPLAFTLLAPHGTSGWDTYYVQWREGGATDVWVYEEANGVASLQRGGPSATFGGDHDDCIDNPLILPDQLVY